MKIIVFGANGMLGRYVSTYLEDKGHKIFRITRENYDLTYVNKQTIKNLLISHNNSVVINCAGAIIQKLNNYGVEKMVQINSIFPRRLAEACEELDVKLIHITTDCVFSGLKGMYDEDDIHDPLDVYGKSKSLGEPEYGTIIRTSIIGEELEGKKSFVEWVKSEDGNVVQGYTRNIWNGITCLQFAKIADQIITENLWWNGVRHFPSPDQYPKNELINIVAEAYELNIVVEPKELPVQMCDRTVATKYPELLEQFNIPTIPEQVAEMKEFDLR
jgi:dTDP-4-dehydrorhamnose reductase